MRFKNLEGKPERKNPKKTIFASGGLGLLQMVSEPDIGRCASKDVEPRMGVDNGRYVSEDVRPRREVDCEIPQRWEKGTSANEDAESQKGVDCEIPH